MRLPSRADRRCRQPCHERASVALSDSPQMQEAFKRVAQSCGVEQAHRHGRAGRCLRLGKLPHGLSKLLMRSRKEPHQGMDGAGQGRVGQQRCFHRLRTIALDIGEKPCQHDLSVLNDTLQHSYLKWALNASTKHVAPVGSTAPNPEP